MSKRRNRGIKAEETGGQMFRSETQFYAHNQTQMQQQEQPAGAARMQSQFPALTVTEDLKSDPAARRQSSDDIENNQYSQAPRRGLESNYDPVYSIEMPDGILHISDDARALLDSDIPDSLRARLYTKRDTPPPLEAVRKANRIIDKYSDQKKLGTQFSDAEMETVRRAFRVRSAHKKHRKLARLSLTQS